MNFLKNTTPYITCKDYTVSNETYSLLYNEEFDLLVTNPVPENLEKYYESEEYISHTDNKQSLFDRVYQFVRNCTLRKKLKLINSFNTENKTILDIGAGTGDFLATCKKNNWSVVGVEPSEKARKISEGKNINLLTDISEINKQQFDVITMWHVLEHIPNLTEYIYQLKSLLKENGVLVIAVPNYKSYDAQHYKQFWAAYDVPRHLWHFSKTSIKKLFSEVNMEVVKTLPMKFDSYYVSLLSEKYKSGKMNPIKSFWVGLCSNWHGNRKKEYSSHIYILKNTKN